MSEIIKNNTLSSVAFLLPVFIILALIFQPNYSHAGQNNDMTHSLDIKFVEISGGSFLMGSPVSEWQSRVDEQQHRVTISRSFLMSVNEITQKQWSAVMDTNPSYLNNCPECPVESVSWHEAIAFCNALSRKDGLEPAYSNISTEIIWNRQANGYRLPTEAEWEYSCRAGSKAAFSFGKCITTDKANIEGYNTAPGCPAGMWRGQSISVGSFTANAWGLNDTHGNVAEWCWDYHAPFTAAATVNPRGPIKGKGRIVRGGDFDHSGIIARSACRQNGPPTTKSRFFGFRLARNIQ